MAEGHHCFHRAWLLPVCRPPGEHGSVELAFASKNKAAGEPVCYGDDGISLDITRSNRMRTG